MVLIIAAGSWIAKRQAELALFDGRLQQKHHGLNGFENAWCVEGKVDKATFPCPQPLVDHDLTALRTCVNRQQPFGTPAWQATIAATLGLDSTLRPRGRPRKSPEK